METRFLLSDQVYAKARIPPTDKVNLWLGVSIYSLHFTLHAKCQFQTLEELSLRPCLLALSHLIKTFFVQYIYNGFVICGQKRYILCLIYLIYIQYYNSFIMVLEMQKLFCFYFYFFYRSNVLFI